MAGSESWNQPWTRKDTAIAGSLILVACSVFLLSPVRHLSDSQYSLLLSQSLLHRGSFAIERHFQHERFIDRPSGRFRDDLSLELEWAGEHIYYQFPPGSSLLSVPFVGVFNLFGLSATDREGIYDQARELQMQGILAALLMAVYSAVVYSTARVLLPRSGSLAVALASAFGTQVWSTASRGMWAHTWEILLLGILISMLVRHEARDSRLRPGMLATLAAWLYFVRPTGIVPAAGLALYCLFSQTRLLVRLAMAGAAWLAGFVLYSWSLYETVLPSYYLRLERMVPGTFWEGFSGNVFSPSRGLLVYVPTAWFVAWLALRYRRTLPHSRLAWLALFVIFCHLAVVASHLTWWGGHSYGARYTSCLVPWLGLIAILGLRARADARWTQPSRTGGRALVEIGAGIALLVLGTGINGLGATRESAMRWNVSPTNIDQDRKRLWDWKHPQFLSALAWPLPWDYAELPARGRIEIGAESGTRFLWGGWGDSQESERWTTESWATVLFSCPSPAPHRLRVKLRPFLVEGKLPQQRVRFFLNGVRLGHVALRDPAPSVEEIPIPAGLLRERNALRFQMPDAGSRMKLGIGQDRGRPGVAVAWLDLSPGS